MSILTELQIFLKVPSRTESPEKAGQSCCGVRLLFSAVVSDPGTCTWMVMGGLEGELDLAAAFLVDLEIILSRQTAERE